MQSYRSLPPIPDSSIYCGNAGIAYANNKCSPPFVDKANNSLQRHYKGIMSTTGGTVWVHPIHNKAGENIPLTLVAGQEKGFMFDYIVENVANVALNTIYLLPDLGTTFKE